MFCSLPEPTLVYHVLGGWEGGRMAGWRMAGWEDGWMGGWLWIRFCGLALAPFLKRHESGLLLWTKGEAIYIYIFSFLLFWFMSTHTGFKQYKVCITPKKNHSKIEDI